MTEFRSKAGRRWVRPSLGLSLASAGVFAVLLALGTWQLQRLAWKEALIVERTARAAAAPIALPALIDDPAALEYRRVAVTGRFRHERELYLGGRTYRRQVGFHVVTPLLLDDGRGLLVDRGWVPADRKASDSRAAGQREGLVTVEGLLRAGGWKGTAWLRPDNQAAANHWIWPDLPAMAAAAGLAQPVTAVYLAAGPAENPGGLPRGGLTRVTLRNDHLQYAITWYTLAAALAVIFLLYHARREDGAAKPSR